MIIKYIAFIEFFALWIQGVENGDAIGVGALFFNSDSGTDKLCPETTSSLLESRDRTFPGSLKEKWEW